MLVVRCLVTFGDPAVAVAVVVGVAVSVALGTGLVVVAQTRSPFSRWFAQLLPLLLFSEILTKIFCGYKC